MIIKEFQQLDVWKQAMDLVTEVYQATARFPKEEIYGLTSQLRRAAVSIPSNIVEGQGRRTTKEFLNHLSIARGSLMEVRTQLEIARRLNYMSMEQADGLDPSLGNVGRLLNGLIRSLVKKLQE